ncbi:hypothetical protein SARC_07151 [Sphaeroforma arctica JP610]|uniref:Uncharacterized protein n=1 Tax=Sphaeroforma arctica JP610 TaxID=667725 RepID=A0A0L0FUF9_9EUKA|nr:hypothetical protein SARC_07151 [Sphaeroforma arctica JP610]KNC80490.1 hypothetical protein SARC_07151 [Sphaeroforma arctica JP610]|eukprot:XP_014154392.1 hypothetical protein SARC_07151 [Sphaeroforma arctica JP610]
MVERRGHYKADDATAVNLALLALRMFASEGNVRKVQFCLNMRVVNALIPSDNYDEHSNTMKEIGKRLTCHSFKLDPVMCHFAIAEVMTLGKKVSAQGIDMDYEKQANYSIGQPCNDIWT